MAANVNNFGGMIMNAVGIDVSKGKSMVAVMRPLGEVVVAPFEVQHTDSELSKLVEKYCLVRLEQRKLIAPFIQN